MQISFEDPETNKAGGMHKGIIICGGGYKYCTNAWVCIKMLRMLGNALPVELWLWENEYFTELETWLAPFNARIRLAEVPKIKTDLLPVGTRWQWELKPLALLKTGFREVLLLDADSFPVADPAFLFDIPQYQATGALFWPDTGRMEKERPIWDMMGIPYRDEPEFESGQMVVDTVRHREPLELALKMNREAEIYYKVIWGDKDTFRFAFHKYGRLFAMTPYALQMLSLPGMPAGSPGVMCQHDFEGNRIFQHRNMAKWDLMAENPRIPGYLYEEESRGFLKELRALWNGRLDWTEPKKADFPADRWKERSALVKDLITGQWLLDDRRPTPSACCGPAVKWSAQSVSKPWQRSVTARATVETPVAVESSATQSRVPAGLQAVDASGVSDSKEPSVNAAPLPAAAKVDPAAQWSRGLRCREVAFAADSTLRDGASPEAYWWDLELEADVWVLYLVNEKGRVAKMTRTKEGSWMGRWLKKRGEVAGLKRAEVAFPFLNRGRKSGGSTKPPTRKEKALHVANHAYGIGDAITGLHAARTLADEGRAVVYHTRYARWLQRASHPLITITEAAPPKGTRDMDADYAEQLRYAPEKVAWYSGQVGWMKLLLSEQQGKDQAGGKGVRKKDEKLSRSFVHPLTINREVGIPRLDFPKYVLLAPFAAWEARDWPETHWRRLAWLLKEAGYEIVAIGTKAEAERMERTFNKSYA